MLALVKKVSGDFLGLARICGPGVATRWLLKVVTHAGACRAAGSLQPADRAMGEGPFRVHRPGVRANVVGPQVLSGVREIWARDTYLSGGFLTIPPRGTVVDLGANIGNFTALALGHGPQVRVVSVEADPRHRPSLERTVRENGAEGRVDIVTALVGGETPFQQELRGAVSASAGPGAAIETISQDELIRRFGLTAIDFLKVDIEGSEFALLTADSPLLAIARQVAIEAHTDAGDVWALRSIIERCGFEIRVSEHPAAHQILGRRATTNSSRQ